MPYKIAINGFGRIGRTFLRIAFEDPEIEITAINDLADVKNLAYLLKYDTVYGRYEKEAKTLNEAGKNYLVINGKKILSLREKDPATLPWKDLAIDVVIESTGVFNHYDKAALHLKAGAKRVVISAPAKGEGGKQVLVGVNDEEFSQDLPQMTSNASCTTNAIAPVMAILTETIGVKKAVLNTIHAYTASQGLVDRSDEKDSRRGRSAAQNIGPSTTGAALATGEAIACLKGNFDGISVRVPIICGSLADISLVTSRETSVEEINQILKKAETEPRWQGIFRTTDEPLVSSDIIKDPYASIADLSMTKVVGGDLVKILVWYDNEWAYCVTLLEHILRIGRKIKENEGK